MNLGQIYLILYGLMALGFLGLLALFVAVVLANYRRK